MPHRRLMLATPALALLAACASPPQPMQPTSVADAIARQPELSTLNRLVIQAGLSDTFKGVGPFTMFAPTNDAFKAVPAKTMDQLAHDPARLKAVLGYHVVPAKMTSSQMTNTSTKTAHGANVSLARAGTFLTVEDAMVQRADIPAVNGVVHTIDRVLMPPAAR